MDQQVRVADLEAQVGTLEAERNAALAAAQLEREAKAQLEERYTSLGTLYREALEERDRLARNEAQLQQRVRVVQDNLRVMQDALDQMRAVTA